MHTAWETESAAERFMKRLVRERACEFMRSPDYLRPLRFDFERAKRDQKRFGEIWAEYGTNVYQLIAESYGETWDAEDEEKHAGIAKTRAPARTKKESAITQRVCPINDDVVAAREASPRQRFDELQGKPEASELVVEEDQGREIRLRGGAEEEEARAQEKGGGRGEDFYARAGGTR